MKVSDKSLSSLRLILDLFTLSIAFWFSVLWVRQDLADAIATNAHYLYALVVFIWSVAASPLNIYDMFRSRFFIYELVPLIKIELVIIISTIVVMYGFNDISLPKRFVFIFSLISFLLLLFQKYIFRNILDFLRYKGINSRNIIIIGAGEVGQKFYNILYKNPQFGYRFLGFVDDNYKLNDEKYLGKLSDLKHILESKKVDDTIIALPNYAFNKMQDVIKVCEQFTTRVKIIPDYFRIFSPKYEINQFADFPVFSIRSEKINEFHSRLFKRIFDIIFTLNLFILLFWWLFPLIALVIKLDSRGSILFKVERWGRDNKRFYLYKFRSMHENIERISEDGKWLQTKKDDPRVTGIGKILRKTNLDELPQFLNVLKGDMSVVGPRPHSTPLNEQSINKVDRYLLRHLVKPGITGWAQVNGHRGDTSDDIKKMEKRVKYDIWYIDNWSFLLDLKIILMTVTNMLKGDPNAY